MDYLAYKRPSIWMLKFKLCLSTFVCDINLRGSCLTPWGELSCINNRNDSLAVVVEMYVEILISIYSLCGCELVKSPSSDRL